MRVTPKHQTYQAALLNEPMRLDVRDSGVERSHYQTKLQGLQLVEYKTRVKKALLEHFDTNLVLRKIRSNIRVSDEDVRKLATLVLSVDPGADLGRLFARGVLPTEDGTDSNDAAGSKHATNRLQFVIRSIVGLESKAVEKAFEEFVHAFPTLTAQQIQFLTLVKQHITDHGMLSLNDLYEAPFTQLHSDGVDGVFTDEAQVTRLINIIELFDPEMVQSA